MAELKQQYDDKLAQKEQLKKKAEHTELMLDRASKLVSGLSSERIRWLNTVKVWSISSSFVAYPVNLVTFFGLPYTFILFMESNVNQIEGDLR